MVDRLRELQTLVGIVDTGSLAAASRRLRRSPSSISRDLADLEGRVGISLVERSTRSCSPTPAGVRLADDARPLLAGYDEAIGHVAGEARVPRGPIRMTAPITFGGRYVVPLATAFLDTYPEITIDLQLNDRLVDLAEENFDLAVRIGHLADSTMIARAVGELRRILVASPAYLEARGAPGRPQDLVDHEIVQHSGGGATMPMTFSSKEGRTITVAARSRFSVNQPEAVVAAACEGRGIVGVLSHQVDSELQTGALVRILEAFEPAPLPVSLVWPSSRRSWRRIRLLIDHLAGALSALAVLRGVLGPSPTRRRPAYRRPITEE